MTHSKAVSQVSPATIFKVRLNSLERQKKQDAAMLILSGQVNVNTWLIVYVKIILYLYQYIRGGQPKNSGMWIKFGLLNVRSIKNKSVVLHDLILDNKSDFLAVTEALLSVLFIYLFGVLCPFQHCTGHITMGCWKGRGHQYIQFVRVLCCKLPTNGKQLPAFPHEAMPVT